MSTPQELGEKIKSFRINLGLSCQAVAEKLKVDKSLYSRYENGERFPSGNRLSEIAAILNVPIEALVSLPLKNTVIYPSGILDELQEANKTYGSILPGMHPETARQNYYNLKSVFEKVVSYRNEALDFPNLDMDLARYSGQTIKTVTLDTRGEMLIDESIKKQMQLLEYWTGTNPGEIP